VRPKMIEETPAQLVAHLSHPNGWWRDTAQQLLVQRNDKSVVPALTALAQKATDWRYRLQAMATLDGMDSIDAATVTAALDDKSPEVRAGAIRMSERWLTEAGNPMQARVLRKIDDPHWQVRRQLAASLGELPKDARLKPIVTMLQKYGNDDVTVDAAISGLAGLEADALALLLDNPGTAARPATIPKPVSGVVGGRAGTTVPGLEQNNPNPITQSIATAMAKPGADAISMLAASIARGRDPATMQRILTYATETNRPEPLRLAILRGGRGGAPGGRGGRGGRGAAPAGPLTLTAEPAALVTIASANNDLGNAARQVLDGLNWPGKPAPVAPTVTRTAEQEARFQAGKTQYAQLCVGCHMDNGQGAEHVGAPLANSRFVIGQTATLVRIMTGGKEGPYGLMPPIGARLTDDQVAALLTYIRGSFGNRATPVQAAEVKETRLMYAYRKTPWTEAELSAGRGGRRGGQ